MIARTKRSPAKAEDYESLYHRLLNGFYGRGRVSPTVVAKLERGLTESSVFATSIRGEEVRSLIAETRGDWAAAIAGREAEIRKIFALHALALRTPQWKAVERVYGHADLAERLDLLAGLYDRSGDTARAISTLKESKAYCEAHGVPFDGQGMLDEFTAAPNPPRSRSAGK